MSYESCSACDDFGVCSGIPCPDHPLIDALIKDLEDAVNNGIWWGDLMLLEEKLIEATESDEEKKIRLKAKASSQRNDLERCKKQVVSKARSKHCDLKGHLKHKFSGACENFNLADEVLADGTIYEGGCWAHKEGVCPFMHPGEEKVYIFGSRTKILLTEGKPPRIPANTVFYSTKEPVRPPPVLKKSGEKDCWN